MRRLQFLVPLVALAMNGLSEQVALASGSCRLEKLSANPPDLIQHLAGSRPLTNRKAIEKLVEILASKCDWRSELIDLDLWSRKGEIFIAKKGSEQLATIAMLDRLI